MSDQAQLEDLPLSDVAAKRIGREDLPIFNERQLHVDPAKVPDRMRRHSGSGVIVTSIGGLPTVRFAMWKKQHLIAVDGTDCGPHFQIVPLPVSERHNGGAGYQVQEDGSVVITPEVWARMGYRYFDELPADWQEWNKKSEAKAAEIKAKTGSNVNENKLLERVTQALEVIAGGKPNATAPGAVPAQRRETEDGEGSAGARPRGPRSG